VNPFISESRDLFKGAIAQSAISKADDDVIAHLYSWLRETGMKYTAGRYFRPGMIFSYLPEAL
jgi:non-lysosomal glucosylceramidase